MENEIRNPASGAATPATTPAAAPASPAAAAPVQTPVPAAVPAEPAKITIETLPAIDLRAEFGPSPDLDEVYDQIVRLMQDTLDALASERRLPIIG